MITISEYELRGELALSGGIGVFFVASGTQPITTIFYPHYAIYPLSTEEVRDKTGLGVHQAKCKAIEEREPLVSLQDGGSIDLVKLSILTISDQVKHYQPSHYEALLEEEFELEPSQLEQGARLMKLAVERSLPSACASLLEAADISSEALCDEYMAIIKRAHNDTDLERGLLNTGGLVKQHDVAPLLFAQWFTYLITSYWLGRIEELTHRKPVMRAPAHQLILKSQTSKPEVRSSSDGGVEGEVWFEEDGDGLAAGLTRQAVERVLQIHNKAIVLDLVKLLVMLWSEDTDAKLSNRCTIEGRYKGLQRMLAERFGESTSTPNQRELTQIAQACKFIDALRVGCGPQGEKRRFFCFDDGGYNGALYITYMPAFTKPLLEKSERLVPILNHPRGHTKSRASYNRLGLAIGLLLVNESVPNHFGGGGVPLNDQTLRWLRREAGFSRLGTLMKALRAFEDDGAITITHNHMRLGARNIDAANLIESGARRQISGSRGGLKAQRKKLGLG